jgi:maltose alpha-D-glucosyltransferase/alpha-amylase
MDVPAELSPVDLARFIQAQRWSGLSASVANLAHVRLVQALEAGYQLALAEVEAQELQHVAAFFIGFCSNATAKQPLAVRRSVFVKALLCAAGESNSGAVISGWLNPTLKQALKRAPVVEPLGQEQSNSSFKVQGRWAFKWYRRCAYGPHPEVELVEVLNRVGFAHVPHLEGVLQWRDPSGKGQAALGIVQALLSDARDGWGYFVQNLQDPRGRLRMVKHATALGQVTAAMHNALARAQGELAPEPVNAGDLQRWHARLRLQGEQAIQALKGTGYDLEVWRESLTARLKCIGTLQQDDLGMQMRHHSDYHLGQVLIAGDHWYVVDFEGEPLRPLAERRAKANPLRDVAGMLRSFSYAGFHVLGDLKNPQNPPLALLEWLDAVRQSFLDAYWRCIEPKLVPQGSQGRKLLLELLELERILYELCYEAAYRPEWLVIPWSGCMRLLRVG